MNERNNTSKIRALLYLTAKKFSGMNKGSKLLLKIGAISFFALLLIALALSILLMSNITTFNIQTQLIQWLVIYSFKFWVVLVIGGLIMDVLMKR